MLVGVIIRDIDPLVLHGMLQVLVLLSMHGEAITCADIVVNMNILHVIYINTSN